MSRIGAIVLLLGWELLVSGQVAPQSNKGLLEEVIISQGERGRVFAVIVGISRYQDGNIQDLSFAHADAIAFRDFLMSPQGGSVPAGHIRLLIDEQATDGAIRNALIDWLPSQATRLEDTVIIFNSGHGRFYRSMPYFVTANARPGEWGGTCLKMAVIDDSFNAMPTVERKLFFSDACHSGAVRQEVDLAAKGDEFDNEKLAARLKGKGRAISDF